MTRVLITGIGGFTGFHLTRYLESQGEAVFGFGHTPKNGLVFDESSKFYRGDICDQSDIEHVLAKVAPDIIYHLAGIFKAPEPKQFYTINLLGTLALFEAMMAVGLQSKVLIVSSSSVYGKGQGAKPITEDFPIQPMTHYGCSTVARESAALRYYWSQDIPVICLRSFNLIGAGLSPLLVCSAFAKQIALVEQSGQVDTIVTGNLSAKRDFTDVQDAVRAYHLAARYGEPGEIYNVCSQREVSIATCLDILISMATVPLRASTDENRLQANDVPIQVGSSQKLRLLTGWKSEVSLEESLSNLLNYWRKEVKKRMNWQGKKVLVTGAGGFIPSHLTEKLVIAGADVRAFVRYNSRADAGMLRLLPLDIYSQLEIVTGDLRDTEAIRSAVQGVDTIFHLGALIAIPYSYKHPREVVDTNVMGTLNVLMAARDLGVRRMVHTSTSEVYGTAQYVPIDEKHPLQGQSPYSASKIGADKIAESFYRSFDLPVITLRPFNTYGPRQSARAVIPTIINQALTRDEVRLGSLTPSRDLTFVGDTADGFLCAASTDGIEGEEINLGLQDTITIGELAHKIFAIIGKEPKIVTDPQRIRPSKSEVMKLYASNQKALKLMGWQPQVSLEEGLRRTIEWISENLDRYQPDEYTV